MFVLRSVELEVNVILGPSRISKGVSDFAGIDKPPAQTSAIKSLPDHGFPGAGGGEWV
jgi:hypothetical protein